MLDNRLQTQQQFYDNQFLTEIKEVADKEIAAAKNLADTALFVFSKSPHLWQGIDDRVKGINNSLVNLTYNTSVGYYFELVRCCHDLIGFIQAYSLCGKTDKSLIEACNFTIGTRLAIQYSDVYIPAIRDATNSCFASN